MIETRVIIVEHTHTHTQYVKKGEKTFHDTCNSETISGKTRH